MSNVANVHHELGKYVHIAMYTPSFPSPPTASTSAGEDVLVVLSEQDLTDSLVAVIDSTCLLLQYPNLSAINISAIKGLISGTQSLNLQVNRRIINLRIRIKIKIRMGLRQASEYFLSIFWNFLIHVEYCIR